jgi:succinoglycan biosynthesis transport protein ExoP
MTSWSEGSGNVLPRAELPVPTPAEFSPRPGRIGRSLGSGPHEPSPLGSDIVKYARIVRERWKVVGVTFVVVTGGVTAGNAFRDPVYRATATIEIRKQAAEVVPVEALFQFERISDQYLKTQHAMLRSPALIRRTLSDPKIIARLPASDADDDGELSAQQRMDALVERVSDDLTVDPVAGSRVAKVHFEASDPLLAAEFLNVLIKEYIAMREESGVAALARLAEQAQAVRAQVVKAEEDAQRFVHNHGLGVVVGSASELENVPYQRMRRLQQELTEAETESIRAEAQKATGGEEASAQLESDLLTTLRARIAALQGEYARIRSTFTDSFPRARQVKNELAQLDSLVQLEQLRMSSALSSQHRATRRRSELLRQAVNEQRVLLDTLAAKIAEYERLQSDLAGHKQLYTLLQQKRKEASVSSALAAMDVGVLEAPVPPTTPVRPLPKRDIPLGALTSLMLGLGLALLRHHADTRVRTHEEVENLSDVRLLALIPSLRVAGPSAEATWIETDSAAEAFRGLRTSVLFESPSPLPRTMLVTSTTPREGKTFVSANLAMSLATLGNRVLLVDADLRRPSLHQVFNITCNVGLAEHLAGRMPWQKAVASDVRPGLDVLPSRANSHNPADLLSSAVVRSFLTETKSAYDFVVIDSPALFVNVPDARILAQAVEGVIFVVRSGATPRELVQRLLDHTPNLIGVVLNDVDVRGLTEYYRDYASVASGGEQ